MHLRILVFITLLPLCHLQVRGQALTNGLPLPIQAQTNSTQTVSSGSPGNSSAVHGLLPAATGELPDDPEKQLIAVAQPEPPPPTGVPVLVRAEQQDWVGDTWTGLGHAEFHYRDYVLLADKVVWDRSTSEVQAVGHLSLAGGANDVRIEADHGDMRLDQHTGRFYQVNGSQGLRRVGRTTVFSTANPFLFSGRVLIQEGEGNYRIVDGSMTNCRLPKPDWRLIARSIELHNGEASMRNSIFKLLGMPLFYLPYVRHPLEETGRETGFLIPVLSNSTIKGFIVGEQFYWVINRSMDMVVGSEYYSKRGWAPNGDFRYKGPGLDNLLVRWNALFDRGVEQAASSATSLKPQRPQLDANARNLLPTPPTSTGATLINQGGVDVVAQGRKDLSPETRIAGNVEYLSSYVYRLVFNDNYAQAISSEVTSDVSATHAHKGFIPSISLGRFQTFASSANGDEARILHLPNLRYDVLSRPLGVSPLYWGLGSSLDYLSRSEPQFHARNVGRMDVYPHLSLPFSADGWSIVPEVALRDTFYTAGQDPDLTGIRSGTPTISHNALNRSDLEASLDIRPPAVERDFDLRSFHRALRHVIEPELTYRYAGGIGAQARKVLLVDTDDIATDTNELGISLIQRFYLKPDEPRPCPTDTPESAPACVDKPREWASWQVAGKFFFDPGFGGALIPGRRNVFSSALDLTGIAFLNDPRNFSPLISRLRFEAIDNLRIEWDFDFDPKGNRLTSDNVYAGYSWGNTTIGIGHALLNAVDENLGAATTIKSQQVQPFISIGKQTSGGLNFAANAGYDFVQHTLQYAGVQAVYNWNCCGLTFGYRRFELGSVRDETQYLYSFTLANFGSVGDVRRTNSVFRDPNLPPAY